MVDTNKNTLLYVVIAKVSIKRYKDSMVKIKRIGNLNFQ